MRFKYRKEKINGITVYVPKIPVIFYNKGVQARFFCYLDSGASSTFIPTNVAELLDLDISGPSHDCDAWNGKFKAFESTVGFIFGKGSQILRRPIQAMIPQKKSADDDIVLGRNFFHYFDVTFSERNREMTLKLSVTKRKNK